MALATFPTSSLLIVPADSIERTPSAGNVGVQKARNFSTFTIDWGGDAVRFSFTVHAVDAGAATLRQFYADRRGPWDPFTWLDPGTGTSWKVQFDGPYTEKDVAPTITTFRVSVVVVP